MYVIHLFIVGIALFFIEKQLIIIMYKKIINSTAHQNFFYGAHDFKVRRNISLSTVKASSYSCDSIEQHVTV